MKDAIFVALQHIVPHIFISRMAGKIANCENTWFKNTFTRWFANRYQVNMEEAQESDLTAYKNFNHFFTRPLKDGARSLPENPNAIVSPADGAISQIGNITGEQNNARIFQAKGFDFSVEELLGCDLGTAQQFHNGHFTTVYLSPKDYHRVHIPAAGTLKRMSYIPGHLFSVNNATVSRVPRLFSRNERVACLFETENGPMAVVLVGAMIVGGMETVWHGQVGRQGELQHWDYSGDDTPTLEKGDELGRFMLGSTAIVLFGPNQIQWDDTIKSGDSVQMGQALGTSA
ncbi:MAG: archaetidylserine decarboxylase [Cellvibrionaceae bacterium]